MTQGRSGELNTLTSQPEEENFYFESTYSAFESVTATKKAAQDAKTIFGEGLLK